ncbi:hypothetical protein LCGC14_0424530 [marine sediment metagenome]|uniref:Phage head-tail adaptor n=1 Tax=marine sediment metagenome TaxID=412755 RepID=A0A0F9VBV1_9ZZZZ
MLDNRNIQAGSLHHRAELQKKVIVEDAIGGDSVTWVKDRDLWCHIQEDSGRMTQEAMQREEQIMTKIFARFNADLETGKRIVHDSKTYTIKAVLRAGLRKEFVVILADEGVSS